eukprot:GFYU01010767.1.p1 GENE.GFYU01010767.1~~GFYU01010767.1.p1  ORF type:complete len:417 (-),score=109.86 GFYU01010767.1:147-1397(-)
MVNTLSTLVTAGVVACTGLGTAIWYFSNVHPSLPAEERVPPTAQELQIPDGVSYEVVKYVNSQARALNVLKFTPSTKTVRGVVLCVHGLHTHFGYTYLSFDYTYPGSVIERYNNEGYVVYTVDHQGHGRSDAARNLKGHVDSVTDVFEDTSELVEIIATEYERTPLFIHGHSFGGLVTLRVSEIAQAKITGLVLTTPAILPDPVALNSGVNKLIVKVVKLLSLIAPALPVGDLPPNDLFPDLAKRLEEDKFAYNGLLRARLGEGILSWMDYYQHNVENITTSFIVFHGAKDTLNNPQGSKSLWERSRSDDKELHLVDNMWHDLMLEPGCQDIYQHIMEWVNARAQAPTLLRRRSSSILSVSNDYTPDMIATALRERKSLAQILKKGSVRAKIRALGAFKSRLAEVQSDVSGSDREW